MNTYWVICIAVCLLGAFSEMPAALARTAGELEHDNLGAFSAPFAEDAGSFTPNSERYSLMRHSIGALYSYFTEECRRTVDPKMLYVVTGRILYGRQWHFISSGASDFASSRLFLNQLHDDLGHTPHQLSLLSLETCHALLQTAKPPPPVRRIP